MAEQLALQLAPLEPARIHTDNFEVWMYSISRCAVCGDYGPPDGRAGLMLITTRERKMCCSGRAVHDLQCVEREHAEICLSCIQRLNDRARAHA